MTIAYTYEIIRVDEAARCMDIRYDSPGRVSQYIGARLPYTGETVDQIAAMYSPAAYWHSQEATIIVPTQGTIGGFTPLGVDLTDLGTVKQIKKDNIASWRYQVEVGGITIGGATIRTDRESQSQLNAAYSSLTAGLVTSINWKSANGTFITLGVTEVAGIAKAVAEHVQASFTAEKALVMQVDACTTVEQVVAIQIL